MEDRPAAEPISKRTRNKLSPPKLAPDPSPNGLQGADPLPSPSLASHFTVDQWAPSALLVTLVFLYISFFVTQPEGQTFGEKVLLLEKDQVFQHLDNPQKKVTRQLLSAFTSMSCKKPGTVLLLGTTQHLLANMSGNVPELNATLFEIGKALSLPVTYLDGKYPTTVFQDMLVAIVLYSNLLHSKFE